MASYPSGCMPHHCARFSSSSASNQLGERRVALRLARVYRVAQATGHLARFVVLGSFVTDKLDPQDVDVFLVMAATFDAYRLRGDASLPRRHTSARACSGSAI